MSDLPGSVSLVNDARLLQGMEFTLPDEGSGFCFINKPAIDLGAISLAPLVDAFEAAYPNGYTAMDGNMHRITVYTSGFGLGLDAGEETDRWKRPILDNLKHLLSDVKEIVMPFLPEYTLKYAGIVIADETASSVMGDLRWTTCRSHTAAY